MRFPKATLPSLLLLSLVLAGASITSAEDDKLRSDYLSYSGTNIGTEVEDLHPMGIDDPCDQHGVGGVRFCDALDPDDMPDRVFIGVRDQIGPQVGFYFAFLSETGSVLNDGYACGSINTWVPHSQMNDDKQWFPDSAALVVRPSVLDSAIGVEPTLTVPSFSDPTGTVEDVNEQTPDDVPDLPEETPGLNIQHPFPCGSPTIANGTVSAVWRYDAPVFDGE